MGTRRMAGGEGSGSPMLSGALSSAHSDQTPYAMLPPERAAHRTASAILKRISLRTCSTYSLVRTRSFIAPALRPPCATRHCALNSIRPSPGA